MMSVIKIEWPAGPENITVDIDKLSEQTQISSTYQHILETDTDFRYNTTSTVKLLGHGEFEISLVYDHRLNRHIAKKDSYWGATTITLKPGEASGTALWTDDDDARHSGTRPFKVLPLESDEATASNQQADEQEIATSTRSSTEKETLIKARRGQGEFRSKVLLRETCCRITGTTSPVHLRASHIKSWADSDDEERLDGCNGLMLAPHIDHLFDRHFISFEDNGKMIIRDANVAALLTTWGVESGSVPPRPFSTGQRVFLKMHREKLLTLRAKE